MEKLTEIKLRGELKALVDYDTLKNAIVEKLRSLPGLKDHKMNVQTTKIVCVILENAIHNTDKKKYKIDKKELALVILNDIYDLTESELEKLDSDIEYLHDNGDLEKKGKLASIKNRLGDFFC
ncbi:MAG: hypothetical protein HOI47_31040 [Candidatus Scalindua sp.]|nr:hypothetical protein [Candidatus Scalindua sp.]